MKTLLINVFNNVSTLYSICKEIRTVYPKIPVTPTFQKPKLLIFNNLGFFNAHFWRVFGIFVTFVAKSSSLIA